jgi:aspartyl-tRNA synthetase
MTADTVSKQMIKYAVGIPLESIVVVEGTLQKPLEDVKTCSISKVEIRLDKIFVLAEAPAKLPFLLEDASRPVDALPKVRTLLFCLLKNGPVLNVGILFVNRKASSS